MTFAHPDNLYFFAVVALLVAVWIGYGIWRRRVRDRIGDPPLVDAMSASVDDRSLHLQRLLQLVAIALLIVAVATPRWGTTDEELQDESLDVVFAVDLSRSMHAEDVPPNRLRAARQAIEQTLDDMESDRVGLVIFTSISFVQSPLTTDHSSLLFFLDRLDPDQIPVGGTNIGAAIQDGVEVLSGRDDNIERAEEQVIVLMTDGEDHESSPAAAARHARESGIRIVAVGIGNPEGATIPDYQNGERRGVLRDSDGERVITRLDEATLREVADVTDGAYLHFERADQAAAELTAYLDELERTALDRQLEKRRIDRFMWFLVPAFALLVLSLFVGRHIRRRDDRTDGWRRLLPWSLVVVVSFGAGCDLASRHLDPETSRAIEAIDRGEYDEALETLDAVADDYDDRPAYHFNRGRALLGLDDLDEARQAFGNALASDDPELRADAHYHMGLAFAADRNWRDAHDQFRRGLETALRTDADDPALTTRLERNLEIALRHLFPPCSTFEDDHEPNTTASQATPLDELSITEATLCGGTDDYFGLDVLPDSTLDVTARFRNLRDEPDPEQTFLTEPDALTLAVVGPDGTTDIAVDDGADTDADALRRINERKRVDRRIDNLELDADILDGDSTAPVFVALRADEGLEFEYDLDVDYNPPCEAIDDEFAPNSTPEKAADLPEGEHRLHLCEDDEDWFAIEADYRDSVFLDIQPETDRLHDAPPRLDVEILRADTDEVVATGHPDGDLLTTGLDDIDFGADLLVRIRGADDEVSGPYTVELHHFPPCPDGNDRYAPNHRPEEASRLDEQESRHRYLRLCPDASDFHALPLEDDTSWNLRVVPDNAWHNEPEIADTALPFGSFPVMQLDLVAAADQTVYSSASEPTGPDPDDADDALLTDDQSLTIADPPDDALLRVDGRSGFYHLERPDNGEDGDPQGDDDDEQTDDDRHDQSDGEDDDRQDGDDRPDDDEHRHGDDETDGEPDGDDDDADRSRDDDRGDDEPDAESPDELTDEQIESILRSLEHGEQNFQLQRAIEEAPTRDVEQDW